MFIPFIKNLLLPIGNRFSYLSQITRLYPITLTFNECFCLIVPVKGGIAIGTLDVNVYRLMFLAPKKSCIHID